MNLPRRTPTIASRRDFARVTSHAHAFLVAVRVRCPMFVIPPALAMGLVACPPTPVGNVSTPTRAANLAVTAPVAPVPLYVGSVFTSCTAAMDRTAANLVPMAIPQSTIEPGTALVHACPLYVTLSSDWFNNTLTRVRSQLGPEERLVYYLGGGGIRQCGYQNGSSVIDCHLAAR
jgi:hypothetical protein